MLVLRKLGRKKKLKTKQVQIVINNGDLVLHGEHLLLNSYDIKLFQSGGVIRHTLNGLLK